MILGDINEKPQEDTKAAIDWDQSRMVHKQAAYVEYQLKKLLPITITDFPS